MLASIQLCLSRRKIQRSQPTQEARSTWRGSYKQADGAQWWRIRANVIEMQECRQEMCGFPLLEGRRREGASLHSQGWGWVGQSRVSLSTRVRSHVRGFKLVAERSSWYWCWEPDCEARRIMEPGSRREGGPGVYLTQNVAPMTLVCSL